MLTKIKSSPSLDKLYNEFRFNHNTNGVGSVKGHRTLSHDKRLLSTSSILSLMTISGYYDEARENVTDKTSTNIVSEMLNISERIVNDSKDDLRGRL